MKLEDDDFPLHVEGNRIYSRRLRSGQIIQCKDEALARDVAERLNSTADTVAIPHFDLNNPGHVDELLRRSGVKKAPG